MVTVITGGGRGIGAATAGRLAADGHDLAIGYRSDRASAEADVASAVAAGRRAAVAGRVVRHRRDPARRGRPLTAVRSSVGRFCRLAV